MATKWQPGTKLSLAISRVEEQKKNGLTDWGTPEHLACIRYLVEEHCGTDGKLDKAALRKTFADESAFLGYASNAKKMLIEFGTVTKAGEEYA